VLQCVRFFNGEMYYSEAELAELEQALARAPLDARREFFLHATRLRRRQQGLYADTPIARFLTPREEWHLIRVRGRIEHLRDHLRLSLSKGVDIASVFERNADSQGSCLPQQLQKVLLQLSPGFSAGDCRDVAELLMGSESGTDQRWTLADFATAFGLPPECTPTQRVDPGANMDEDLGDDFWSCPHCTFINPKIETSCGACGYGWTGRREPGKHEWVCPPELGGCSVFNSKDFFYCKVCNKARPDLATIRF